MPLDGMSGSTEGTASEGMGQEQGQEGAGESGLNESGQQDQGRQEKQRDYSEDYYRRVQMMAKKEREFLQEKKRWSSVEQRLKEAEEKLSRYEGLKSTVERDPEELLKAYDLDMDKFSQIILKNADGKVTKDHLSAYDKKIQDLVEENKRLKEEFGQTKEQLADEARAKTYNNFTGEITEHIEKSAEKYPLLSEEEDREGIIFDVIKNHWEVTNAKGNPRMLSIDEACQYADKVLANRYMAALKSERRRKALGINFAEMETNQESEGYQETPREDQENPTSLSSRFSNRAPPPATKTTYRNEEERRESMRKMLFGN